MAEWEADEIAERALATQIENLIAAGDATGLVDFLLKNRGALRKTKRRLAERFWQRAFELIEGQDERDVYSTLAGSPSEDFAHAA